MMVGYVGEAIVYRLLVGPGAFLFGWNYALWAGALGLVAVQQLVAAIAHLRQP
jgi:hypothetical protein